MTPSIVVRPANEVSWEELQSVFGPRGEAHGCQCQWFKVRSSEWRSVGQAERAERLRVQTGCDNPGGGETTGLVAFLDGVPVGWCAVEPRSEYPRLRGARVPWTGRREDPGDPGVWSLTCFVTRVGYRKQGVSRALARAAVDFARGRGARALEGYPIVTREGQEFSWGELYVGSRSVFAGAGFTEVSRPTPRRAVMRIDFAPTTAGGD